MTVFVRFAPSPTGLLHIGNIRAALFNYLFAQKNGGRFLLRLDDTDQERSTQEFATAIEEDMKWLGLNWDTFEKQSNRMDRYEEVLEDLKKSGRVYPCFETPAELSLKRKTQLGRGLPPVYDRSSLKLSAEAIEKLIADGHKPHWRFKLEHTDEKWEDGVQGSKSFPTSSISDPVLVRADGIPLYTYCSVVDDIDMGITHIIRGEDHVTNTSVQLQIWKAITDKPAPEFAHYPLLVSADGTEMSKRLGTLSIREMRMNSNIEAMSINSLLGKIGTSDPIAPYNDMKELAATFDLDKISRATPKFDMEDLVTLSAKIIHQTPYENVKERLDVIDNTITERIWNAVHTNLSELEDMKEWMRVINGPLKPVIDDKGFMETAIKLLPEGGWDDSTWGEWTKAVKAETGCKGKQLFMPLRQALTALAHGPEMKLMLPLIGRTRALKRLGGEEA